MVTEAFHGSLSQLVPAMAHIGKLQDLHIDLWTGFDPDYLVISGPMSGLLLWDLLKKRRS